MSKLKPGLPERRASRDLILDRSTSSSSDSRKLAQLKEIRKTITTPINAHLYDMASAEVHSILHDWTHVNVRLSYLVPKVLPNPFSI